MNKLNFMGIGPKVGAIILPWLAVTIFISLKFEVTIAYSKGAEGILFFFGLLLVVMGSMLYFVTVPSLLAGLKKTKLITTGAFYLCCNPLYSAIILFIIPGISFMMNSWLVLTTSIIGFILLKIFIKREYVEMEMFFGEEYRKYKAETPEFLPFPIRKWFRISK